jgi:hypothetical protein
LQERNEVRVFEARNLSKASVLSISTKHVLQRFVEKREAEKNEHDLKRFRSEGSPSEIVGRPCSREEQRALLQVTGDPRPILFTLLGLSLAGSNPDDEWLGHGRHGENLGHWGKREDGELNVPPRGACARGDLFAHGVAIKCFGGGYFRNRHASNASQ